MISPYVDKSKKPRLIEPPQAELKAVQKRIKTLLGKIEVPDNVFSGIKGRSYSDNARLHLGENTRNLYKIDLTAFFPSISREAVYLFFFVDLCCSPDVAEILANLTTVDLKKLDQQKLSEVYDFLADKGVKCYNHLISAGTPRWLAPLPTAASSTACASAPISSGWWRSTPSWRTPPGRSSISSWAKRSP